MKEMNLEPIIHSKIRNRKTSIMYRCIHMESRKMVLIIYLQGSNGDTDIDNGLMGPEPGAAGRGWREGGRGWDERIE